MKKIGILYMCTGKYNIFWKDFYESFEKFFLKSCDVHYYVFTDADILACEEQNSRIHRYYQPAQPWPLPTLFRYQTFLTIESALQDCDYLFFFNANCQAMCDITEEMILPRREKNENLVVVNHPVAWQDSPKWFSYDRNPFSTAFVPCWSGQYYVCGGINGGETAAYLQMCHQIDRNINKDYRKGIVALWHDESHLNKYIIANNHYRLLPPNYAYPEEDWFHYDNRPIISLRDKSRYFSVDTFKSSEAKPNRESFSNRFFNDLYFNTLRSLQKLKKYCINSSRII